MGVETEIRAEMARQGVTVVELAEKTGLKRPYLSLRLNGHKGLLVDHLVRIGAVLGVSPAELMRRADRTSPALADEMPAPPTAVGGAGISSASAGLVRSARRISSAGETPRTAPMRTRWSTRSPLWPLSRRDR